MRGFYFTRMTSFMLVFGFFFFYSCAVSTNTLQPAEEDLRSGDYLSALESVNRLLEDDPNNEEALLLKVQIFSELARAQGNPDYRSDFYRDMRAALEELPLNLNHRLSVRRDSLVTTAWGVEQDAGVRLLRFGENQESETNYTSVISHLDNALIVNPDSAVTWNLKATSLYMQGDISQAIATLESAMDRLEPMPVELRERLAFLYLEEGDIDSSVEMYETLYEENPQNETIVHGLINAYILDNDHHQSVVLLRQQVDQGKDDIIYREALATELYFLVTLEAEALLNDIRSSDDLDERFETLFDLIDEARLHFNEVLDIHPDPDEVRIAAAAFFKNSAQALLILSGETQGDHSVLLSERGNRMLRDSIPLWESIVETSPENPDYWRNLYQVYNQLGMTDEAESARTRGNL